MAARVDIRPGEEGRKDSIRKILMQVDPTFVPDGNDVYVLNEPSASKVPLGSFKKFHSPAARQWDYL